VAALSHETKAAFTTGAGSPREPPCLFGDRAHVPLSRGRTVLLSRRRAQNAGVGKTRNDYDVLDEEHRFVWDPKDVEDPASTLGAPARVHVTCQHVWDVAARRGTAGCKIACSM